MSDSKNMENKIPGEYEERSRFEQDAWSVFKIMGEFVEGYDKLLKIGPCVSIFGSARLKEGTPHYNSAVDMAMALTKMGFGVITGGGPGIMEAANRGANLGKGKSVGLCIQLPFEEKANIFCDFDYTIHFNYFFARKVMFVKYAQGFVVYPGGLGTLDELFEALTLIQTKKISPFPIILMGKDYWSGLVNWIRDTMVKAGTVSDSDLNLFHLTDSVEDATKVIYNFYQEHKLNPNF
ncbi:MAG: TIGR00730 family Rossman fold protein [Balneolales bacterium]